MINSLLKDSHITRQSRFKNSSTPTEGVQKRELKCAAPENMKNSISVKKPAEINFGGFLSPKNKSLSAKIDDFLINKAKKLASANWFKKMLVTAADNPIVFSNGFALLLTCLLRPVTICALPGKKNKDDKKYAAASSIASGVIGFGMAVLFANPISEAMKKLLADAKGKKLYTPKYAGRIASVDANARGCINQMTDVFTSCPKAIITIAILPPILKYVFGLEKKSGKKTGKIENMQKSNVQTPIINQAKPMQKFMGGQN